jgi:uncharacterized repeat protein (TIGR01451 family)
MKPQTGRRSTFLALGALTALASMQLPAVSHQSPEPCNSNDPAMNITKDRTYVRPGDTVTYRVEVHNLGTPNGPPCDISDAVVTLTVPGPDGQPSGPTTTLATGLALPAGTGLTQFNPVTWTVALDPGVDDAVVRAELSGVLHDAQVNHAAHVVKTLGTSRTAPWTELSVVATPPSGPAPHKVTFTYTEKNTGNGPISQVVLTDDVCSPVTRTGGDTDNDNALDVGESWTFTCTTTIPTTGTIKTSVKATGVNMQDSRPAPDEFATATVTVGSRSVAPTEVLGEQTLRELPRTS